MCSCGTRDARVGAAACDIIIAKVITVQILFDLRRRSDVTGPYPSQAGHGFLITWLFIILQNFLRTCTLFEPYLNPFTMMSDILGFGRCLCARINYYDVEKKQQKLRTLGRRKINGFLCQCPRSLPCLEKFLRSSRSTSFPAFSSLSHPPPKNQSSHSRVICASMLSRRTIIRTQFFRRATILATRVFGNDKCAYVNG